MNFIAAFLARRTASSFLATLAEIAISRGLDLSGWRRLIVRSAEAGDLDAVYLKLLKKKNEVYLYIDGE
jgi:hypothetical protein